MAETNNARVYKEYEFRDRDDVSDYDVAFLDERSRHSEEIVEAASHPDLDSFKEALDDLDPQARKEAVRMRLKMRWYREEDASSNTLASR